MGLVRVAAEFRLRHRDSGTLPRQHPSHDLRLAAPAVTVTQCLGAGGSPSRPIRLPWPNHRDYDADDPLTQESTPGRAQRGAVI